jgi:hypothetical protein
MGLLSKVWSKGLGPLLALILIAQGDVSHAYVHYDGSDWKLTGQGIVCCPCKVPCPCRSNGPPSYGHCEATLYLRIHQGNYEKVKLDGMQVVESGGMCAVNYQKLSALYFEPSTSEAQRLAFMKILASFSPPQSSQFSNVRVLPFNSHVESGHLFKIAIPGALEMVVDRNWGKAAPPMPMVAAQDYFSNALQYAENIRYWMHDPEAGLDFDYSRRQANYRVVNLRAQQYREKSMLIQFGNGKGSFTPKQLQLIRAQHLALPRLQALEKTAQQLRTERLH